MSLTSSPSGRVEATESASNANADVSSIRLLSSGSGRQGNAPAATSDTTHRRAHVVGDACPPQRKHIGRSLFQSRLDLRSKHLEKSVRIVQYLLQSALVAILLFLCRLIQRSCIGLVMKNRFAIKNAWQRRSVLGNFLGKIL
ncbi:hypothetical protein GGI11_005012 [Coemansia sp. RSA 2049]|nr:hypothetical protein GGI11_005012 [Coemansia sp. RSA 2049]